MAIVYKVFIKYIYILLLKYIMIAFEYVTGSHTAVNIKKQYNAILKKYCIEKKYLKR